MTPAMGETMTAPVLIIGGGIAGTIAAIALRRAGIEAEVFEAYDGTGDGTGEQVGGMISLAVNGLRALRVIDCLEPVMSAGVQVPTMQVWTARGRPIGRGPRHGSNISDIPSATLLRGRMVERLHAEARRRGITVHPGKRLVAADRTAGGVTARFGDGTQAEGAVLIGADGVHSTTRQIIDPAAPTPAYAGVFVLGGTAEGVTPRFAPGTFHAVLTEHGMFAFVAAGPDRYWWTAQIARPDQPGRAELAELSSPQGRARLAAMYAGHAATLIGATEHFHSPTLMYRLASVPTWQHDSMIAIGDAAHPVDAGIGGSLAIEDAVLLAKCLRDIPAAPRALASFEHLRRPRIDPLVRFGTRHKKSKAPGPIARRLTQATLPVLMPLFMKLAGTKRAARLYAYDIDWDTPVHEPDGMPHT
jgi:2-polyprenyl-6-methoxyphenol hydroxylase-like FAD-dependent oxidoreductase